MQNHDHLSNNKYNMSQEQNELYEKIAIADDKLYKACKIGNVNDIDLAINDGAIDVDRGLFGACKKGHMEIVKMMIDKGATDFLIGLDGSVRNNNFEIFKMMADNVIVKSKNQNDDEVDFGDGWEIACTEGKYDFVKYMIKNNARKSAFDFGLSEAAGGGHLNVLKLLLDKGASDIEWALNMAECGQQHEIIQYLKLIKK